MTYMINKYVMIYMMIMLHIFESDNNDKIRFYNMIIISVL
jgi:hypothetical protein